MHAPRVRWGNNLSTHTTHDTRTRHTPHARLCTLRSHLVKVLPDPGRTCATSCGSSGSTVCWGSASGSCGDDSSNRCRPSRCEARRSCPSAAAPMAPTAKAQANTREYGDQAWAMIRYPIKTAIGQGPWPLPQRPHRRPWSPPASPMFASSARSSGGTMPYGRRSACCCRSCTRGVLHLPLLLGAHSSPAATPPRATAVARPGSKAAAAACRRHSPAAAGSAMVIGVRRPFGSLSSLLQPRRAAGLSRRSLKPVWHRLMGW